MIKELEVFSVAKVCMDSYKSRFDRAKAKKKKAFEDLNKNYVPGSPVFIAERDKITPTYEKEVEAARKEALTAFEDALEKAIACEKAHATVITNETTRLMSVLDCLKDSPVSVDEYNALVEVHGSKSCWVDRFFEKIAEKNGIYKTGVQPSLTAKLEILNELAENTRECLNNYNGENKNFVVTSSDKYILGLEGKYTNGYSGVHMSDTETAKRLVNKALSIGDSLERSCTLANILRTSTLDIQYEILCLLAEDEYPVLSDPTMNFVGVAGIINKFKKENLQDIKAVDTAMVKVKSAKSHQERIGAIYDNLDNRHFVKAIEKYIADTNNRELKESYKNMQEIKQKESQKER
ncbi:MAG: hypothetical protein OSJ66_08825 [Clostridia bacterium]|nr:hypothetical protein [Clostridia bacterium]